MLAFGLVESNAEAEVSESNSIKFSMSKSEATPESTADLEKSSRKDLSLYELMRLSEKAHSSLSGVSENDAIENLDE